MLKIDMAFLRETTHVEKSQNIIKSIIQMAKCIGTDVITEGVETADQLEFLNNAGCDNFQGYYFDKPLPVEQFEQKYLMKQIGE
jgi:EAL domain-containing protein (putative c-di-GMP-specific phosphodiesterase class I)